MQSNDKIVTFTVLLCVILAPAYSLAAESTETRILHFPDDRALGRLTARDAGRHESLYGGFEPFGEARGKVTVPAGKELILELGREAARDLSPLAKLKRDDLYGIDCWQIPLGDQNLEHLAKLEGLHVLSLRSTSITSKGLYYLRDLKSLKSLSLSGTKVRDDGMAFLSNMHSLGLLNLRLTSVTDDGLAHLSDLKSLKGMDLGYCHITDTGLEHLGGIRTLESIDLSHTTITDAGLAHLKNLRSLNDLDLYNTRISSAGLAHLRDLTSLKKLNLSKTRVTDSGLAHLANARALEELRLRDTRVTDSGVAHLRCLRSLKLLDLGWTQITDEGLVHLAGLEKLRHLEVLLVGLSSKGLAHFSKLKSLESLDLMGSGITDEAMPHITTIRNLRQLTLQGCQVANAGLANLTKLKSLTSLGLLNNPQMTGAGLVHIGELSSLESLVLYEIYEMSDDDIAHLSRLKKLKDLGIDSDKITDAGFAHLSNLHSLEILSLQNAKLTDQALSHLPKLKKLEYVHLAGNFTDEGLKHLEELSLLRSLTLSGKRLSLEALEKLQKKLPLLAHLKAEGASPRSRSLIGKQLAEFEGIDIDFRPQQAKAKILLVCFWDMEQRPSRNCLQQLSTRAQELKAKDVVVVAIQASKVDENTLNEWVKNYHIPFPVGMVQGDEEKTRFAWGVRSLPWRILTDRSHVVTAEGFGLDELGQKLNEKAGITSGKTQLGPTQESSASANTSARSPKEPEKPLQSEKSRPVTSEPSSPLIRVVGVARDQNGKPIAGVEVRRLHGPRLRTDPRGEFELLWDPKRNKPLVDTYYIIARHEQENLSIVVEVPEFEQETKTVILNLLPGVILTGKVVDPAGRGIELARVSILLHTPTQGSGLYNTITDSEGIFEFRGIPTGHEYSFLAKASGFGTKWMHDIYAGHDFAGKDFKLEPFMLSIADESVSGLVVDANDKPVPGARLRTDGKGQPNYYVRTDAEGKFTIDGVCPGNLRIYATVSGEILLRGYARTHGGATNVRIVVTEVVSPDERRFIPKKPPSLVGKALPKLKDLGIELSSAEGSIAMLLCFFDIEQRPSRHCVMELAKRAEELKEKGVTVVAVQASKVDENALNEWVKKYNIPFTVGMIQGDEEEIRFTWGVRSLPWLILTDGNHIVTAEGFVVNELDEKIKGAGGGKQ